VADTDAVPALSGFIGRERAVAHLTDLIDRQRVVTIVGSAGIGKTRLADECRALLAERFPDGRHRVELAPLSPRDDVRADVAGALGFPSEEALLVALSEARALVVIDNCEHVLGAARVCVEVLVSRCPHVHVLSTSREPLGVDGEYLLPLSPLEVPADTDDPVAIMDASAVRLFADRMRAGGARWDDAPSAIRAVAALCRRLDGVPLAIELAAARARALSPAEILRHLDRRFDLLQHTGPIGTARHASLRAAIDTSYQPLDEAEQGFFRALGVFDGGFEAALAHDVTSRDGDVLPTIDRLARLVDRSLVVAEPSGDGTVYSLLESIRQYAADAAHSAGEWDALLERFVDVMVGRAAGFVAAGRVKWGMDVLAPVRRNRRHLVKSIEACTERDATADRAFRLLMPLWAVVHQGHAAEVAAACDRILVRWPDGGERLRGDALAIAASAYLVDGRVAAAVALATATLDVATVSPVGRTIARRVLGLAARHDRDREEARRQFSACRDEAAAAGLAPFAREGAYFLASVAAPEALDEALASLTSVGVEAAAGGDPINQLWAQMVATGLLLVADRRDAARAMLVEAESVQARLGGDYPPGRNALARLRTVLRTLEEGWLATRGAWASLIDDLAAAGDLSDLADALCDGVSLAADAGDEATAGLLRAAIPDAAAPSQLGVLFDAPREAPRRAVGADHAGDRLRAVRRALAAAPDDPAPAASTDDAPATPVQSARAAAERTGEVWSITFAGRSAQVPHAKGLDDLVVLLSRPEQEVHCMELMGGADAGSGALPGLDEQARRAYRARVRELQEVIDDARARDDHLAGERAEAEIESIVRELSASFGRGGRIRPRGAAAERARSAVAWRIRSAIRRIAAYHPELGRHLENAVRTGAWCVYRPETPVDWELGKSA